jgi:hypothetical protein
MLTYADVRGWELVQACSSRAKTSTEYPYEFFEAMHVTWHRLAEGRQGETVTDTETVTELLRKLAFVDPCHIPVTLFEHLRHHLPILLKHGLVTVLQLALLGRIVLALLVQKYKF